ncbi:MAG: 4Fe-4S ferredoxin [Nitrospirae bacterium RBG_19FT_COMBO_42_15]|nr:MAG: 4Fe-4S ferredoxin [Nitrospirae bacterium RBG_19FT_COMBO_42_15]
MAKNAMLIDVSRCIACRACQVSCKQWNRLPAVKSSFAGSYENPSGLSSATWRHVRFRETVEKGEVKWRFLSFGCMHCKDASCVFVCPVPGALTRRDDGTVYLDEQKCTGCKYCISACPFDVPHYDDAKGKVYKCNLCADRTANGLTTACAKTCPSEAIRFGDRDSLIKDAKSGGKKIYGENELGGLSVMYVLQEFPSFYGLPERPAMPVTTAFWKKVLKPLGYIGVGTTVAAIILHYIAIGPKKYKGGE